MACLKVWIKHSTAPFEDGWYGAHLICLMPFFFMKSANSSATNWGPLSETTCSGNPWAEKSWRRVAMVWIAEVVVISNILGHLEWASTTTRNDFPRKGPAKSIWMRCQGFVGHVHGCKGAGGGAFLWL